MSPWPKPPLLQPLRPLVDSYPYRYSGSPLAAQTMTRISIYGAQGSVLALDRRVANSGSFRPGHIWRRLRIR
jgi:hypothetical protein